VLNQKPLPGDLLDYGNPLSEEIIAFWLFNNDGNYLSNKVFDLSGNAYDGILQGGYIWTAAKYDNGLDFNGTTGLFEADGFMGTGDLTLIALVYAQGWGENVRYGNELFCNGKIYFAFSDESDSLLFSSDGGNTRPKSATSSIALNTWTHCAATRTSAGVVNFYVDGVLSGTADQASGTPAAGSQNDSVGGRADGAYCFDGIFDHAVAYNRILPASEISQLYQEPFCMFKRRRRIIAPEDIAAPVGMTCPVISSKGIHSTVFGGQVIAA